VSSAGGAQFRVALRMYTTHSCHLEMTVWDKHVGRPDQPIPWGHGSRSRVADMQPAARLVDALEVAVVQRATGDPRVARPRRQVHPAGSCGGIPSVRRFTASPVVDCSPPTGTGYSATTDSTRAPPLRHCEYRSEARVPLGPHPTAR
jgi:hypothetical protein